MGVEPKKILLAEDNEDHVFLCKKILSGKFKVEVAREGREVLEKLRTTKYDLVLLDYHLPDVSGLKVLEDIKNNNSIPVIIITGQGSENIAVKALTHGAIDYIVKTESFHQGLVTCVEKNLEKHELQQEVRKTKDYLQRLVETAPICIISTDLTGRIVSFNKHAEKVYGYDAEEVIGKHAKILQPEKVSPSLNQEIYKAMLFGEGWDGELFNKRKNGEEFPIHLITRKLDENGEPMGLMSLAIDITERKKMERELREYSQHLELKVEERTRELKESERRYRDLFEATQDAVYRSDENSVFVSMNQAGAEMFGFSSPSEIIGHSVLDFWINPEDRKVFLKELESSGSVKEFLIHAKKRSGEEMFLEASSRILRDELGNFTGVEGILRDITERLRLERALKDYSELLEEKVAERTKELAEANRLKDLFTDIMRHDLLNPVGLIRNYAELLLDDEDNEVKREDLNAIIKTSEKLVSMIENASKYEMLSSVDALEFEERDLSEILEGVIKQLKPSIKEKKIKVEYSKRQRFARVHSTFEDVFANILSNSIKYSPEETAVTIKIHDRGRNLLISVADQGSGIPDKHKVIVFERFERGGKTGVKGTGLGLAIVKRVVELHKGRVWVEDNPRGGSIFYVELPKGSE